MQYYPGEKYGETRIIEGEIDGQKVVYRMTDIVDDNDNTISYRYTILDEDDFEPFDDNDDSDVKMSYTSRDNYITLRNYRVIQQQTGGRKRKRKTHKKRKSSRRRKSIRKSRRMKSRRRK
jgi:hypothetical protein